MKTRSIVVASSASEAEDLLDKIESSSFIEARLIEDLNSALDSLPVEKPEILFIVSSGMEPWAMEMIGSLNILEQDCFVVYCAEAIPSLQLKRAEPHARTLSMPPDDKELLKLLDQFLEKKSRRERFRSYRGADFLLGAGLAGVTMSLNLVFEDGVTATVEIVEGSPWSAYYGELTGLAALEQILHQQVQWTTARKRSGPPNDRQLELSWQALFGSAVFSAHTPDDMGTKDLGVAPVVPLKPSEVAPPSEEEADQATVHLLQGRYDRAITRGLRAALARDYEGARRAFGEALEERPEDPLALFNLARLPGSGT